MDNEVKNILAQFLKVESAQITSNSIIDKTTVGGSIMVHRLYASLADKGFTIKDYLPIKTVGQLLDRLGGNTNNPLNETTAIDKGISSNRPSIGIDIESINNLPQAVDFRNDAFYTNNFSAYEISYCLLKENPRASFAGLFAAKEAISKIDDMIGKQPFNQIEISHTSEGKPSHGAFEISISHASDYAIGVAVFLSDDRIEPKAEESTENLELVHRSANEIRVIKRMSNINLLINMCLLITMICLLIYFFI